MISTLEFPLSAADGGRNASCKPLSADLRGKLDANADRYLAGLRLWFFSRPPNYKPSEWLETAGIYLQIDATQGKSQADKLFSFTGREYLRDLIDQIEDPDMLFQTFCAGTGAGKTLRDLGIILSEIYHNPFSGLYVMPALTGSGSAAGMSRKIRSTLEASPVFADRLPKSNSARKESLTNFKIEFGGNNIEFVGGQSAGKLGDKRCRLVFIGEQDKTKDKLGAEEGADYLAGERTKGVANTKIFRGSSPSMEGRAIWKALMGNGDNSGSDCRRRFLPCPHCNPLAKPAGKDKVDFARDERESSGHSIDSGGEPSRLINNDSRGGYAHTQSDDSRLINFSSLKGWFVLIKDAQYNTALPTKLPDGTAIPFAEMRWDKEAKRKDGGWDMDRVIRSTRFECPHCGGHIVDKHRLWLDKNGVWIPTRQGEVGHAGFQLSSFYAPLVLDEFGAPGFKSTWGGMAQKFLNAIESGTIGGYINSDLAEVNTMQDMSNKIELSTTSFAQPDWIPILTADFHKNHPFLWFVVRKWCAFKLHPPGGITNGVPDFVAVLGKPGNEVEQKVCTEFAGKTSLRDPHVWQTVGELLRFEDPRASAVIDFLLAQKITGEKLHKIFREESNGLTMDFRRVLYRMLSLHLSDGKDAQKIRAPLGGDSELVGAGYCDHSGEYAWDELREYIQQFEIGKGMPIPGRCVGVDCGYAEKFHREVLQKCHESGSEYKFYDPTLKTRPPMFFNAPRGLSVEVQRDGWFAMRGKPSNKPLGEGKFNYELNTNLEDPYFGTTKAGSVLVEVLEFPSGLFWNHKNNLRLGRTKNTYSVSPNAEFFPKIHTLDGTPTGDSNFKIADYQKHLNEQFYNEKTGKVEPRHGRGGGQSRAHPYHLDDCENENLAIATYNEFFDSNPSKGDKRDA